MSTWEEITQPQNLNRFVVVILNGTQLVIRDLPYKICEIELYYYTPDHPDEYVHKNDLQLTFGQIYFHQFGNGTYKNGTFRGMNLTFGRPGVRLSILIRSIYTPTGEVITGPCNVVNHLLKVWGYDSIAKFVNAVGEFSILTPNPVLYLQPLDKCSNVSILTGPRVGLSDKYPLFKSLYYRFVSQSAYKDIKKQKRQLYSYWDST